MYKILKCIFNLFTELYHVNERCINSTCTFIYMIIRFHLINGKYVSPWVLSPRVTLMQVDERFFSFSISNKDNITVLLLDLISLYELMDLMGVVYSIELYTRVITMHLAYTSDVLTFLNKRPKVIH